MSAYTRSIASVLIYGEGLYCGTLSGLEGIWIAVNALVSIRRHGSLFGFSSERFFALAFHPRRIAREERIGDARRTRVQPY
jgi:hypothetical protein